MKSNIFVAVILSAMAVLSLVDCVRDRNRQEDLNEWSARLVGKELLPSGTTQFNRITQYRVQDLPLPYRIIRPGQPVTDDYRSNRLNIDINNENIVTKVAYY